ncbi:uncharacterized protein RSE6_01166 [Rhynchosporium secalis]|uniref:Uncharacterized protein n=1 Tax=Rhynchosporium secalis TaxID=38038 RepID=A0A1E1LX38_RHYSE|nr:uncharacterized protein RSE6_01166 [Rhynchosporium secalis]
MKSDWSLTAVRKSPHLAQKRRQISVPNLLAQEEREYKKFNFHRAIRDIRKVNFPHASARRKAIKHNILYPTIHGHHALLCIFLPKQIALPTYPGASHPKPSQASPSQPQRLPLRTRIRKKKEREKPMENPTRGSREKIILTTAAANTTTTTTDRHLITSSTSSSSSASSREPSDRRGSSILRSPASILV